MPKTANASPGGVQALSVFMPSHYVQSMAKPTGSKVDEFYLFKKEKIKILSQPPEVP